MLKVFTLALLFMVVPPRPPGATSWVTGIPDCMQMNDYSCGVACVQAVAMRYGHWGYQAEWAKELGTTPEQGTHPVRIVRCLRRLGLQARLVERLSLDDLKRMIDRGDAVIVDFQAWAEDTLSRRRLDLPATRPHDYAKEWECGHYGVAVGYSATHVYIEDPSLLGTVGMLTHEDFLSRWHDYELENGRRREYIRMAIVVPGPGAPPPPLSPID